MTAATSDIKFRLALDGDSQVVSSLTRLEDRLGAMQEGAKRAAVAGLGLAVVAPRLMELARSSLQAADTVTQMQNALRLSTGSAVTAGQAYDQLYGMAQRARVGFADLTGVYTTFNKAGRDVGLTQDRIMRVTEAVANAMTVSGGSAQSMKDALVQLAQGLGSGVLRGDELNSVIEQTPRLAQALAQGLGVSTGELKKLGEAGALTAEKVLGALEKAAPQLAQEVKGSTVTVGQAFTVLSNSTLKFVGEADQASGASRALAGVIVTVAEAVTAMGRVMREHEGTVQAFMGALAGVAVVGGVMALGRALAMLPAALAGIGAMLAAHPAVAALLGVGAAVGAVASVVSNKAGSVQALRGELEYLQRQIVVLNAEIEKPQIQEDESDGEHSGLTMSRYRYSERKKSLEEYERTASQARIKIGEHLARIKELQVELAAAQGSSATPAEDARLARYAAAAAKEAADNKRRLESTKEFTAAFGNERQKADIEIQKWREKMGDAFTPEMERAIRAKVTNSSAALKEQAKIFDELAGLTGNFREDWDRLMKAYANGKGHLSIKQLEEAQRKLLEQQPAIREVAAAKKKADEEAAELREKQAKQLQHTIDLADKDAEQLEESVKKQLEHNEAIGANREELLQLTLARIDDAIAMREYDLAEARYANQVVPDYERAVYRQIDALKALRNAKQAGYVKEAAADAKGEADDLARKLGDSVTQSLSDALMRGFESGKSFSASFVSALKNSLKTLAVQVLVQPTVQRGAQMGGQVFSMVGQTLGNTFGLTGDGGILSSIGSSLGFSGGQSVFSMGSTMAMNGGTGAALEGAMSMISEGSVMTGLMQGAGALMPWVAAAGLIYQLYKASKKPSNGDWARASLGSDGLAQQLGDGGFNFGNNTSKSNSQGLQDLAGQVLKSVGQSASVFGGSSKGLEAIVATDIDRKQLANTHLQVGNVSWESLGKSLKDSDVGTWFSDRMPQAIIAGLQQSDLPARFKEYFSQFDAKTLSKDRAESILATAQAAKALSDALAPLGGVFGRLKDLSVQATSELFQMAGGADKLQSSVSAYAQAFYSDAERATMASQYVQQSLAALGVTGVATRAQFRSLVDSLDLSSASGRQLFTQLMALAPSFAQAAAAAGDVAAGAVTAAGAKGLRDLMSQINGGMGSAAKSLADRTRAAVDAQRALVRSYDRSQASIDAIQQATQDRYQLELQLIEQIDQALADVHATAQGSVRSMRLAISDDSGKYGIYDAEAGAAMEALKAATDPERIKDAFARFNGAVMDAWGLLNPEQQKASFEALKAQLEQADQLATSKLQTARSEVVKQQQEDAQIIGKAILAAISAGAKVLESAAEKVAEAVSTPVKVQVEVMPPRATSTDVRGGGSVSTELVSIR